MMKLSVDSVPTVNAVHLINRFPFTGRWTIFVIAGVWIGMPVFGYPSCPQIPGVGIGAGVIPVIGPIAPAIVDDENSVLRDRFDDPVFLTAVIGGIMHLLADN